MKGKIFIIILLLLSFSTEAQLLTDGASEEIVGDIILNYKDKGITKFKIIYKHKSGKKLLWKDVFYYSFENDSVLHHKYEKYKAIYILKDNEFIYQDNEDDKKRNTEYLKTNYFKEVVDSNVITWEKYEIQGLDTVLCYQNIEVRDTVGNKITISNKSKSDDGSYVSLREKYYLINDTIRTIIYRKHKGRWLIYLDDKNVKEEFEKKEKDVYVEYIIGKQLVEGNYYPLRYRYSTQIVTKTIYYTEERLIEKIIVENKEIGEECYIERGEYFPRVIK